MKSPTNKPGLRRLKSFTADYRGPFTTCTEVATFCTWVRRIVAASPIQALRIVAEGEELSDDADDTNEFTNVPSDYVQNSYPAFDSLIEHLTKKHAATLQHLQTGSAFVSLGALQNLLERCQLLETLHVSAGKTALVGFCPVLSIELFHQCVPQERFSHLVPISPRLHAASFEIRNIKPRSLKLKEEDILKILHHGSTSLRGLAVNGRRWEVRTFTVLKLFIILSGSSLRRLSVVRLDPPNA